MSTESTDRPPLTGFRTTYQGMFEEQVGDMPQISRVVVPLIQRDYAQGRVDVRTSRIRTAFLDALLFALTGPDSVGLDFIYGEVDDDGTFEPLDGQQRLTTLFLLHWHVAARLGRLDPQASWTRFSYATRPSARLFCERIVKNPPPPDLRTRPSRWITDQSWYLYSWKFDPTVHAMLVTLDAIHDRFADQDAESLWQGLTDSDNPAIWFQLLPISDMGAAADLYIKMNSRGKPLTEFEAFKAQLGKLVERADGPADFGHKIDGAWTDVLWPYRGDNDIVDDEFVRYFDFLVEICEWREGRLRTADALLTLTQRAELLLAPGNPRQSEHLDFICQSFDTWVTEPDVSSYFETLFTTLPDSAVVRIFGANADADLFRACGAHYGEFRGTNRAFSLTDTLLLLAVLVHRTQRTDEPVDRLRTLRNLAEASQFEMRVANMPKFVNEVAAFMETGDFEALQTFNTNQVNEETKKRELRVADATLAPALTRIENHSILRGSLASFELDSQLADRSLAFEAIFDPKHWPLVTGALLACGEYQRGYADSDRFRFGSPTTDSIWRLLLVDRGDRDVLAPPRGALMKLLDVVAAAGEDVEATLSGVCSDFVRSRAEDERFDWRYYLVRYSEMREGNTGIYFGANQELGYEMTMLRKTTQASFYRDPYLYAMWCEAGRPSEVDDPWFFGYSTNARWMKLLKSGVGVRSVADGIAVSTPPGPSDESRVQAVLEVETASATEDGWLLRMPQRDRDGRAVDTVDRVRVGSRLLRRLIDAGL